MRVNYLIACSSHRLARDEGYGIQGKDMLRMHIEELAKTNTEDLAQVTIIQAMPLVRYNNMQAETKHFWDIDEALSTLNCPSKYFQVPNAYFSYSSWIHAVREFPDFDYYILIEDDYYPALKNFVPILVDIHKRKLPNGGYLNGFTVAPSIGTVSNGICDAKSILEGINRVGDPIKAASGQTLFGRVLFNDNVVDYTDEYRTLFKSNKIVEETHDPDLNLKIDIFNPIQYLVFGEQDFEKVIA